MGRHFWRFRIYVAKQQQATINKLEGKNVALKPHQTESCSKYKGPHGQKKQLLADLWGAAKHMSFRVILETFDKVNNGPLQDRHFGPQKYDESASMCKQFVAPGYGFGGNRHALRNGV